MRALSRSAAKVSARRSSTLPARLLVVERLAGPRKFGFERDDLLPSRPRKPLGFLGARGFGIEARLQIRCPDALRIEIGQRLGMAALQNRRGLLRAV